MSFSNPIMVFISSCARTDELKVVRRKTEEAVNDVGLFKAYVYETHGATSMPAEVDYLAHIKQSHVCIFVIEDEFQVTEAVQKELDAAHSLGKKCFYYFYKNDPSATIAFQEELRGASCPTTYQVGALEELPARIASDLVDEMKCVYRLVGEGFSYDSFLAPGEDSILSDPTWSDAIVGKTPVQNFPSTKAFLAKVAFDIDAPLRNAQQVAAELTGKPIEPEPENDLDKHCALFLGVVLGERTIDEFNVALLHEDLETHLPKSYADVAKARWRGIQQFFLGNTKGALGYMREALEIAESGEVAEWLIDDILIDLRNLDAELNGIAANLDEYQKRLADKEKPLVYPIADRMNADMYGALIEESYKQALRSPGAVVMFEDVTRFLDGLAGLAMVAVLYGSYTYIRLLVRKLREVAYVVNLQYKSRQLERLLLKLALIDGNSKDAKSLFSAYGDMLCGLTAQEAAESFRFICNCATGKDKNIAILEAFAIYGSYMDDDAFNASLIMVRKMIDAALKDEPRPGRVLAAITNNAPRIKDKKWLLDVCRRAIERGEGTFWREEGLKLLSSRAIDLNDFDEATADAALMLVRTCMDDEHLQSNNASLALIRFRAREGLAEKVDSLAQGLSEGSMTEYVLNHPECGLLDPVDLVMQSVALIEQDNELQGKGGAYSYGRDNYLVLEYAIEVAESNSSELLERAVYACLGTLRAKRQTLDSKFGALRTLVPLAARSATICDLVASGLDEIELEDGDLHHEIIFGGPYERLLIRVCFEALKSAIGGEDDTELRTGVSSMYRVNEFSQMKFADFITRLAQSKLFDRIQIASASRMVSFLQFLAQSSSREVRGSAYCALASLVPDERFGQEVVSLFLAEFKESETNVKHVILNVLDEHPDCFGDGAILIKQWAARDANYFIRIRA